MFLITVARLEEALAPEWFWFGTVAFLVIFLGALYLLVVLQNWLSRPRTARPVDVKPPQRRPGDSFSLDAHGRPWVPPEAFTTPGTMLPLRQVPPGTVIDWDGQRLYVLDMTPGEPCSATGESLLGTTLLIDERSRSWRVDWGQDGDQRVKVLGKGSCQTTITVETQGYYYRQNCFTEDAMPVTYLQAHGAIGACAAMMHGHGDLQSIVVVHDADQAGWHLEVVFFDLPRSRYVPRACHGVEVRWRVLAGQYLVEQHGSVVLHSFAGRLLQQIFTKVAEVTSHYPAQPINSLTVEERWDGSLPRTSTEEQTDAIQPDQPEPGQRDQCPDPVADPGVAGLLPFHD